ncbi:unnamed protein product, partial [Ectocarpus sp. 8 AP-2014]
LVIRLGRCQPRKCDPADDAVLYHVATCDKLSRAVLTLAGHNTTKYAFFDGNGRVVKPQAHAGSAAGVPACYEGVCTSVVCFLVSSTAPSRGCNRRVVNENTPVSYQERRMQTTFS